MCAHDHVLEPRAATASLTLLADGVLERSRSAAVLQNFCGAYLDRYFPGGVKEIAPFAFMAVFLLWKPFGIWGWDRIERV